MSRRLIAAVLACGVTAAGFRWLARGALTLDVGVGRRVRPLGPINRHVRAPRETVFDVIAEPYLGRTTRALASKLQVLERGTDMVLAAHSTPISGGDTAITVETVRFERPGRVSFRLVRGPVPHVIESFELTSSDTGTEVLYTGELGTDFWGMGQLWGDRVARVWERTVASSLDSICVEAERRATPAG